MAGGLFDGLYLADLVVAQWQAHAFQLQLGQQRLSELHAHALGNMAALPLAERGAFAPYMGGPSPDATQRARALLSRLLSPGQRRQYAAHGSFIQKGSDGRYYV